METEDNANVLLKKNGSHFTYKQKLIIIKYWIENNWNAAKASKNFYLPYSSVYRILHEYKLYGKASLANLLLDFWNFNQIQTLAKIIRNYWLNQKSWFTISDVANYLSRAGGIYVKHNILRGYMRDNLKLSFKKASSRPVDMNIQKQNILKQAFTLEFSSIVSTEMLMVNIDEVNFSYQTKNARTWIPKGWNKPILNTCFKGTRCFICAITSNGHIFISWLTSTNKSDNFIDFLNELKQWIKLDLQYKMTNVVIILDNWRVHKSRQTIAALNKMKSIVLFLPAYTPEYAPIELFFNRLKKLVTRQWRKQVVNLNKTEGERNIREAVACISKGEIVSYWSSWVSKMKQDLRGAPS